MKDSFAFGARVAFQEAKIVLLPVPWEATVSGGGGTAEGPLHIRSASHQMDFFSRDRGGAFNHLIYFCEPDKNLCKLNKETRPIARKIMERLEKEGKPPQSAPTESDPLLGQVNAACAKMADFVYKESAKIAASGKITALVGGDHSVSEGLVRLLGEKERGDFGLLHIDAHLDKRNAYQGFERSHASSMRNILGLPFPPRTIVHVGIRDFAGEEAPEEAGAGRRLDGEATETKVYFDEDLQERLFRGESWLKISAEIIAALPRKIYVSLDVDGLEPSCAPGTGTPVPGGLSYNQALFLLKEIKRQGKVLIGFDVTETACPEPLNTLHNCRDGKTGAALLYFLSGLALPD